MSMDDNPSENNIAQKTSNPKLNPKKLNTPTVRRRLRKLVEDEFVKYLGRGKQRSRKYALKLKGLFYLLSYEKELTDTEIMKIAGATIKALPMGQNKKTLLRTFIMDIGKETVDIINEVKHRINFDFFDENYVSDVFFNSLFEHCLKLVVDVRKSSKRRRHSTRRAERDVKALKSNPLLNKGLTLFLEGNVEYFRKQKQKTEEQYRFSKEMWERWKEI